MPLTRQQIEALEASINNYSFPTVYYDFDSKKEVEVASIRDLEPIIRNMLRSERLYITKNGLANIIYWGNANAGYQMHRTEKFIKGTDQDKIQKFQDLVVNNRIPTLKEIADLKMPQYSGISFISKIVAFLDPENNCVLDLLLSRLQVIQSQKAIHQLKFNTQISVTKNNCSAYSAWCNECKEISTKYFSNQYRAVDIERGFFNLIQSDKLSYAQQIYISA